MLKVAQAPDPGPAEPVANAPLPGNSEPATLAIMPGPSSPPEIFLAAPAPGSVPPPVAPVPVPLPARDVNIEVTSNAQMIADYMVDMRNLGGRVASTPSNQVAGYRITDAARRALSEEMRKVRRAAILEANGIKTPDAPSSTPAPR